MNLTLHFVPFQELEALASEEKIEKLLSVVKRNKVVIMQGKLKPSEETRLIQRTMEEVSKEFKGIELCTIKADKKKKKELKDILMDSVMKFLIGERDGMTIIGPATIVKEIKRNPGRIELLTYGLKSKNGRK